MDIEIAVPRPRKVTRRLDEYDENQHFLTSNEEIFRVTFYEVLDIMISEFGRFNQESRQYLTLLGRSSKQEDTR